MISARFNRKNKPEAVDMTHVEAGDCFIKVIDVETVAHLIVEEVVSEQRFMVRFLNNDGERTGSSFPMTAQELSKHHPNIPANIQNARPKVVNG